MQAKPPGLSIKLKGTNSTVIHQQDKIKYSRSIYFVWFASVCWKENGEFTYLFRAYSLWYLLFLADSRVPTQLSSISKTKSKTADLSTWTGLPVFVGKKMVSSHTYLGRILCGTFCFQQTQGYQLNRHPSARQNQKQQIYLLGLVCQCLLERKW